MELTSKHREYLLSLLDAANDSLTISKLYLGKAVQNDLFLLYEIDCFIQEKNIELIKKALTENTIEF